MGSEIFVVPAIFIGLPWVVLHYMTKWKRTGGISQEDEQLLDDLYDMARRLDERMATMERIFAADHPDWKPGAPRLAGRGEGRYVDDDRFDRDGLHRRDERDRSRAQIEQDLRTRSDWRRDA